MTLLRPAQLGFASSALGIDDSVLAAFSTRFAEPLHESAAFTIPFTLDALSLTLRADGPLATNAVRRFLLDVGFPEADDQVLADLLEPYESEPLELTATAQGSRPLAEVGLGLVGRWDRRRAWEALPGLGVDRATRVAWDRLCGSFRPRGVARVDVAFDDEGRRVEIAMDHRVHRGDAGEWGAQLRHAATRTGVPSDQAAWLGALFEELARPPVTACLWTMVLRPHCVEPRLRVTWAGAPVEIVLQLAADLAGTPDFASRLGVLTAAAAASDDRVWRLMVEVGEGPEPQGAFALRLDG